VAAIAAVSASVGAVIITQTQDAPEPEPWWLFVVATFAARFRGGNLAGWLVAAIGCFASAYVIRAPNLTLILVRLVILCCVAGVRSQPARSPPVGANLHRRAIEASAVASAVVRGSRKVPRRGQLSETESAAP
jgi:hypothetical protein